MKQSRNGRRPNGIEREHLSQSPEALAWPIAWRWSMLSALIAPEELGDMKSKAPVVIIIAIILMGVLLWVASAFHTAGGVSPEEAKALAEEAERECVLEGHPPDVCPKLVGRHHRGCLERAERRDGGSRIVDRSYFNCMARAFGEPERTVGEAGESGGGAGASTADVSTGDASSSDVDPAETSVEEAD